MSCDNFAKNECCKCDKRSIVAVKENKCQYQKGNPKKRKVCLIKIDGCYRKSGRQCDFVILECENKRAFFIELKGKNVLHAIDQINSSIDALLSNLDGFEVNARIVLTKVSVPNLRNNPRILKLEKKLRNLNNGNLVYSTIKMEE